MALQAIKFSDPAYNGGAVSDGFLDTATGNLIEPGNTNGNFVDPFGWQLAQYQAGAAVMDTNLAGQIRGECASTGITPMSTWEYIGKPLVIMAAAVAGGELLGAAGAASAGAGAGAASGAGTLAPTVIATTAAPVAAAPIALGSLGTVSAGLGTVGAVGAVSAGGGLLSGLGGAALGGAEQVGEKVALGAALTALTPSLPKLPAPKPVASNGVTGGGSISWLLLLAGAAGLFLFGGIA